MKFVNINRVCENDIISVPQNNHFIIGKVKSLFWNDGCVIDFIDIEDIISMPNNSMVLKIETGEL